MNSEFLKQKKLVEQGFNLGFWYGVHCKKCCDVYPKLITVGSPASEDCFYECPVCGKKTVPCSMPWISEDLWNTDQVFCDEEQLSFI